MERGRIRDFDDEPDAAESGVARIVLALFVREFAGLAGCIEIGDNVMHDEHQQVAPASGIGMMGNAQAAPAFGLFGVRHLIVSSPGHPRV